MAKLYFKYGAMGAGKSLELLKTADNYMRKGRHVLLMIPNDSGRDGEGVISSRVGLKRRAVQLMPIHDPNYLSPEYFFRSYRMPDVVLVDEAQFLTREEVESLARIVDRYDTPVICFGLKNDFRNELFPGSAALLALADKIEEIRTICHYCDKKATMNMRTVNGKPTKEGPQKQIGDTEYISVCRKCYDKAFEGETA